MVSLIFEHEHNDLRVETFPIGSFACNCSLIYSTKSKECIIVDPGNDKETLIKVIQEKGLKVTKLIHTHAHFDHIGHSASISKLTSAPLYLHKGDLFLYENLKEQGLFFGAKTDNLNHPIDFYLEDEQNFNLSQESKPTGEHSDILNTLHTPGHTPGSCCFLSEKFKLPLLFSGDTLFQRSIGRTDLPGGDSELIIKSIKDRLLTLHEETNVIPGHGPLTQIYTEKKSNPFIS
jgi:hydroxyacylglutathione hydrolase